MNGYHLNRRLKNKYFEVDVHNEPTRRRATLLFVVYLYSVIFWRSARNDAVDVRERVSFYEIQQLHNDTDCTQRSTVGREKTETYSNSKRSDELRRR